MSESKFLKYQDKNNDGLNDVCPDEEIVRVKNCPDCKRNPNAVVPKWKKRDVHEPWFNDKYCTYQITIKTTDFALPENVDDLFDIYRTDAVQGLLDGFDKEEGADAKSILTSAIENTKYYLDVRGGDVVRLLYTVSYEVFTPLPERFSPDNEEEDAGESITFTYDASNINPKLLKLRKAMYLYSRYYRVYQALENGSFIFIDNGKVFTKTQFDRYGDLGFFLGTSRMKDILSDLDNWLNDRGMNIFGVGGGWGWFRDRVTKVEFTLTPARKLKKMKVWTATCREKPRIYKKRRLKGLTSKSSWKDPTAVNYFSKLDEIDNYLSARVERPWIEFVKTYTYPEVSPEFNYPTNEPPKPQTAGSCLADALAEEGKALGQDILDDVFSIGDAIAYTFHKNMCPETSKDIDDERNAIGLSYKPESEGENIFGGRKVDFGKVVDKTDGRTKNIFGMATEQAFQQLYTDDQIFTQMCARMLSAALPFPGGGEQMIHDMWKFGFGRIKICGLLDLMIDAIQCLFKGLSLEDALASALKAALKAMSIENFGDLFVGLPPDKQAELDNLVKQKLANNDILPDGATAQYEAVDTSGNPTGNDVDFFGSIKFKTIKKPWKDQAIVDAERSTQKEGNYPGQFPRSATEPMGNSDQRDNRTLAQQYDGIAASAKNELDPNVIMEAYALALIETYSDNLLGLTDLLNKYPGAQIIANIIAAVDCPTPPIFDPSLLDFLKSIDLPFCRNTVDITLPRLENPMAWLPYLYDIPKLLFEALLLAIQTIVIRIIMKILVKICQIIGDAICKALEIAGGLVAAIPRALATGDAGVFGDVIKEAICGPEADDSVVDATIAEMFEKLGVGGAALADTQAVKNFAGDISSAVTREEMIGAFSGNASADFVSITFTILENQYPQFLDGLPTESHLQDFFADVGNLFPAGVKAQMSELANALPSDDMLPANPSLCATPEDLENFKERRCLLLEGRASPAQCEQMFKDLQNETLEDLDELTSIVHSGIPQMLENAMPPIVSQPGCDDGLIPFESPENQLVTGFALAGSLKQLEMDYAQDMLAEGSVWSGDSGWGMLNMILSDTNGNPFTTHQEKVADNLNHVDFVIDTDQILNAPPYEDMKPEWLVSLFMPSNSSQNGQYPAYVAEWLWQQLRDTSTTFRSSNESKPARPSYKSFDDLGWEGWFWTDVNLLALPEFGWNVKLEAQMGSDRLRITKNMRKKSPDVSLSYYDNANGLVENNGSPWNWGYGIELYLSEKEPAPIANAVQQQDIAIRQSQLTLKNMTQQSAMSNSSTLSSEDYQAIEENLRQAVAAVRQLGAATIGEANRPGDNARIIIRGKRRTPGSLPPNFKLLPTDKQEKELQKLKDKGSNNVTKYQRREFYTVDNTLDSIDTVEYPKFNGCFTNNSLEIPQVVLLSEILNKNGHGTTPALVKSSYDSLMTKVISIMRNEIVGEGGLAPEKGPWLYGASYDDLTLEDLEYVVDNGQTLSAGGTEYADAELPDYDDDGGRDGERSIENDDMILGISRMQHEEESGSDRKNRIFYLDPGTYGGSHMSPKIYIKPPENIGWRGFIDVIYPELSPCKPSKQNLIGFKDIEQDVSSTYNFIPEDQRLRSDPDCVSEKPYNRILERSSKAGIQGVIRAACRIYGGTHLIKSFPTFSTFAPRFPETCSSLYSAYIVDVMEESLKDAQESAFWEFFNTFKDEEFWYAFLEQAVQTYGRLVDDESIQDPPEEVLQALFRLNDMQEKYNYPYGDDLDRARDSGRAEPWPWDTLNSFRYEENLNAVKATEDDAKLVLKELVSREMNIIGELFVQNMKALDMQPQYTDLDYYLMSNLSDGAIELDLDKKIEETIVDLETEGSGHYTFGDSLSTPDGEPYNGYYHVHEDEDGNKVYMVGEEHTAENHDELTVYANKIIVPIGDIAPYGGVETDGEGKPFTIEKYIKINNVRYHPDDAIAIIKENEETKNISDIYPGTLEQVHFQPRNDDLYKEGIVNGKVRSGETGRIEAPSPTTAEEEEIENTRVVGLKGELGVRYGIKFSVNAIAGAKQEVAHVEIDALDTTISQFPISWEGNSKLLLCLLNKLKEDNDFRLIARYVFPLTKVVAMLAIYNDYGFMPAIGEKAVANGAANSGDISEKPGVKVVLDDDGVFQNYEYTPGWAAQTDRASSPSWPMSWFVARMPWDEWDRVLMRNSKSRLKSSFKGHYNQRDFKPWDNDGFDPAGILLKNLKSAFALPALAGQMPWWTKKNLIGNPFDATGVLCKKS